MESGDNRKFCPDAPISSALMGEIEGSFIWELSIMGYSLQKLAPGSYDLLLDGTIIGSVVQCGAGHGYIRWIAELLEDLPKPQRPFPFQEVEHEFLTLGELCAWLGIPVPAGKIPAAAL